MNHLHMSKSRQILTIGGHVASAVVVSLAFATLAFAQNVELSGDVNTFYKDAREDISKLIAGASVDSAVVFNNTKEPVTFYVYNYIDTVYWVSAQRTLVAPGRYGTVVASGKFFKVHPNDNKDLEFLVAPGKAYVYNGPGSINEVRPE